MISSFLRNSLLLLLFPISVVVADSTPAFPVGAYNLPDGEVLVISDFGGGLRFFTQGGRTGSLKKTGKDAFEGSERHLDKDDTHHTLSRSGAGIQLAGPAGAIELKPIASGLTTNIDAMLLAYGPVVALHEEDRWGYAYWLEQEAYTRESIAQADELHEVLMDMFSRGRPDRWHEFKGLLKRYRDEPWYKSEALSGADSTLSAVLDSAVPLRLMYWWASLFGFDTYENYDPAETLENLQIPSYWLFAGEDSSMPTPGSIDQLSRLAAQGQAIEYKVYPETEHGLVKFKTLGPRDRQAVSYHPDYFNDTIGWLKETAGKTNAISSN